jgi:hypothetical protein
MQDDAPTNNGTNGRDPDTGRFEHGNNFGKGRPPGRVNIMRDAMRAAITDDDIHTVMRALVDAAKAGDIAAAREVLNRAVGRAPVDEGDTVDEGEDWANRCPIKYIVGIDPDAL